MGVYLGGYRGGPPRSYPREIPQGGPRGLPGAVSGGVSAGSPGGSPWGFPRVSPRGSPGGNRGVSTCPINIGGLVLGHCLMSISAVRSFGFQVNTFLFFKVFGSPRRPAGKPVGGSLLFHVSNPWSIRGRRIWRTDCGNRAGVPLVPLTCRQACRHGCRHLFLSPLLCTSTHFITLYVR